MGLGKLDSGCLFRTCTVIIQQWQLSVPSSQGPPGILTSTFLLRGSSKGLGLVLDDLGAGPRKHWFALDRVQSGNRGSFLTILVNLSIKWTKSSKLKLWLVKKQQSYLARQGTPGHFCGLDNVHVCVSVQTRFQSSLIFVLIHHSHRVVLSNVDVLWNHLCPTRECQGLWVSGPALSCQRLLLSHTLYSVWFSLLHSPQSSMVKFTLNSQFIPFRFCFFCLFVLLRFFFLLRDLYASSEPHFLFFPEEKTQFHLPTICIAGNDKVCSAVHVLQKCHIDTKYWLSWEFSTDASKLGKESSFSEPSYGSATYTVIDLRGNFACLQLLNFLNL